jgi:hypothetical protein
LPYISSRLVGDADVVAERLGHLALSVDPDEDRHRQDRLLGLAVGALDVAPEQQVELLVGAAELDVGVHGDRVIALQQRVEQLEHRDRLACREAFGEVVALEQLRDRRRAQQREQLDHRHVQPLAVAPHLQQLGIGVEDLQRLLLEGGGVGVDLRLAEHRAQARAPRGVPHARGVVADDQHDTVTGVLELAQLAQHDRVTEVDVRRGRIDAELHAQLAASARAARSFSASAPSGKLSTALRLSLSASCAAASGGVGMGCQC